MAIEIRLTDDDAISYMTMMAAQLRYNPEPEPSASTSTGDQVGTRLTNADLQEAIDEFHRKQGIEPAVEIRPTPEETVRIYAEIAAGNVPGVALPSDPVTETVVQEQQAQLPVLLEENNTLLSTSEMPALTELFGGQPAFQPVPTTAVSMVVPVPPPTTVPSQAAANVPPAVIPTQVQLDVQGLPWDQRIHSGTKSINKDGTWRLKKGVDAAQVTTVTAELKALMAARDPNQMPLPGVALAPLTAAEASQIPLPPRQPIVPGPPASAVLPAASSVAGSVPVPPPPPASLPNPNPAVVPGEQPITFVELMFKSSQAIAQGRLTKDQAKAVCAKYGVPDLPLLGSRLDLVPAIAKDLGIA